MNEDKHSEIIIILNKICKERKITLEEMCRKSGLCKRYLTVTISKSGDTIVPFRTLRRIANALELSNEEFINLVETAFRTFHNFEIPIKDLPPALKKKAQKINFEFWVNNSF